MARSQNRQLIAISTKHHSLATIRNNWLIIYPASMVDEYWAIFTLFSDKELILNIDPFHMILAYLLLFLED